MTSDPKALRELAAAIDPPQIYVSPLARAAAAAALYALATELEVKSAAASLLTAAQNVGRFDWSDNDHDAVKAIAKLRACAADPMWADDDSHTLRSALGRDHVCPGGFKDVFQAAGRSALVAGRPPVRGRSGGRHRQSRACKRDCCAVTASLSRNRAPATHSGELE